LSYGRIGGRGAAPPGRARTRGSGISMARSEKVKFTSFSPSGQPREHPASSSPGTS